MTDDGTRNNELVYIPPVGGWVFAENQDLTINQTIRFDTTTLGCEAVEFSLRNGWG